MLAADGADGLDRFDYYLQRLDRRGWIRRSARQGHEPLATLVTFASLSPCAFRPVLPDRHYQLSRFAYTRRAGGEMVLESPLAHSRVVLHDWRAAALVHALTQPGPVEVWDEPIPGLAAEAVVKVMTLLLNADMLCERDGTVPLPRRMTPPCSAGNSMTCSSTPAAGRTTRWPLWEAPIVSPAALTRHRP